MHNKFTLTSTKAGHRLMGFMAAFNAGDPDRLREFIAQYTTDQALEQDSLDDWVDQLTAIYALTGGLRVFQLIGADEYRVVVLMQSHANSVLHFVEMAVSEDYPHKILEFSHRPT
jgi:hypothetical protein